MRLLILGILFFCSTLCAAGNPEDYARTAEKGIGAVASVNPMATQAGIDALEKGGNAFDALAAVAYTLGVVDSSNSGIGGGCFVVARLADGTILAVDGREMAPAKAHRDMYLRDGKVDASLSKIGALAVGVPGSVAAIYQLQSSYGNLKLNELILPAAKIAEEGFVVGAGLARRLNRSAESLAKFESTKAIFLKPDGSALKEGDRLIQKDLATTYRKLAEYGPDYFYRGEFAKQVAVWMKENGGLITVNDFENYQLLYRSPVETRFKKYSIIGFPPPSSGGTMVAEILNILSGFDLKAMPEEDRYHVIIEAMKLAFADRAHWMGDPDFAKVPAGLVDSEYAAKLAAKIDVNKASTVETYSIPPNVETHLFGKHTTHISTADKHGNWIAMTTTLNTGYGSKVVIPGTGVLMNNQMDDFSAQPGVPNAYGLVGAEANSVQPRKRPLSSMSPTIVLQDGKPVLAVGAAGGPTIINQVVQTLINVLALDMPIDEAMAAVRVHQQWKPSAVFIDDFASDSLRDALTKKGHELKNWPPFGATQAIHFKNNQFHAVAEPRLISRNE